MQNIPDNNTLQQVLKLAQSPAGQKLMAMLQSADQQTLSKARQQAADGDYATAKDTLSSMLHSAQMQQIIQEMRNQNG